MNTTTNTRGVYHAAHVKAVARALQTDDAAHYAADAAHMLEDYAAALEAALSAEPAAQGEAVAEWQRKCPDYPNRPNLGCPCAPATKEKEQGAAELVDVARHNRLVVGPLPHTHVRLQQKAYDAARAAFGTTTEADDRAVYWAVQAYLHASEPTAPPAQPAERVPSSIATDDDVERIAKIAGWDNRRYMTRADYAVWCERMREFVRLASPAPSEGGKGVNDTLARELYIASQCDAHNLHTLAWHELTEKQRDEWRKKATGAAR